MVDTIGWANAVGGAPAYSGRALRQLNGVAFAGATSGRPLGARSGVRPGTSTTTVTATSTAWTCGPVAGIADVMTAAESGAYPFSCDLTATGGVMAASASYPRVDIVYVLITDPENGTTVPTVTRGYLAGTAAASPVTPVAPTGAFTIANINVPISGGGAPTVTWVAPYAVAAGGMTPVRNQGERNAQASPIPGQSFYLLDSDTISSRNGAGTGWLDKNLTSIAYTPSLTFSGTLVNLGAGGSVAGKYSQIGKMVFFRVEITFGTAAAAGAGNLELTFPLPAVSSGIVGQAYYYNGTFNTFVAQNTGATMVFRRGQGTSDTWGSAYAPVGPGNVASISGQYEAV
jgi:hypothetical protein